jgi:endonuclease YncB( thermonuclease family)
MFKKFVLFILASAIPLFLTAHSGGTDSNGCHTNRKTGDYHCHGAKSAPPPAYTTAPAKQSPTVTSRALDLNEVNLDQPKSYKRFSGKVVAVEDGDTISVIHGSAAEKVRLYGIDCPEDGQAYSIKAKQFTSSLAYNQVVTVVPSDQDKYGRTVADVILPNGASLTHEIVKAGYAWWFRKYAPDDETLRDLEAEAKNAKRGLWTEARPVEPWLYRSPNGSGIQNFLADSPVAKRTEETVYITRTGAKYHRSGCHYLKSIIPISIDDAKKRGYSPCSICKP